VSLNAQVTETTLLNCECQLVHALLRLSRHSAGERDGSRVTLKLTQQDLADAIGIARETVNGMLSKLAELQLIAKRRGRISFDLVQLEQWASHLDAAGQKPVASE
jgi:CRP-like cAMP-binding protein